jgi:hypothetical protein
MDSGGGGSFLFIAVVVSSPPCWQCCQCVIGTWIFNWLHGMRSNNNAYFLFLVPLVEHLTDVCDTLRLIREILYFEPKRRGLHDQRGDDDLLPRCASLLLAGCLL